MSKPKVVNEPYAIGANARHVEVKPASWWAVPGMTREQFNAEAASQQAARMLHSKHGQMRGGPSIDHW